MRIGTRVEATEGDEAAQDRTVTTQPTDDKGGRRFLAAVIEVMLTDPAVPPVFAAATGALEHTLDLKRDLATAFDELLARAHAAGVIDSSVTESDMTPLMCGIAYAANMRSALAPTERASLGLRYLDLLLTGLHRP